MRTYCVYKKLGFDMKAITDDRQRGNNWKGGRFIHPTAGYVMTWNPAHHRANSSGYVKEHILIAEKALGYDLDLPHVVHHVNQIRSENQNNNLVICEDAQYHALLHVRTRVLRAGGDPNLDKICPTCKAVTAQMGFYRNRGSSDGLTAECKTCTDIRIRARARAKQADRLAHKAPPKRPYVPHKKVVPRICAACGSHFLASQAEVNRGNGRVCSLRCRSLTARAARRPDWYLMNR